MDLRDKGMASLCSVDQLFTVKEQIRYHLLGLELYNQNNVTGISQSPVRDLKVNM
jgi:hypothetical protein